MKITQQFAMPETALIIHQFGSGINLMEFQGRTVQIVYNKSAGRHSRARLAALRNGFEEHGAAVILSECGPDTPIAIDEDASLVCAVGGDGTVRHVALAVSRCGRSLPMSVYPMGTVNLVHREAGARHLPYTHAERAMNADRQCGHYSVRINDTLFLACASVGPDSRAVAALSLRLKRAIGRTAYLVAFARVLVVWRRDQIEIVCDDRTLVCEAFYVAKGRYFAGPWSFAPEARLDVPLLHVVALEKARRRDFVRIVWALLLGRRVDALQGVTAFSCEDFCAKSVLQLPVQADGDIVAHLPADFKIISEPLLFR